jgi:DNA primase
VLGKEDILSRLTPQDVYGERLVKTGTGFKMNCPFHSEKTPSFHVKTDTLAFHCFGCGTSGDAFTFVMKKEQLEFPDAIKVLAKKAGVDMNETDNGNGKYSRLYDLNKAALQSYGECLRKSEKAMAYLTKERGLTSESIEKFHLGCTNGTAVVSILRGKGFTDDEILDSGIAKEKDGEIRDHFRKRIIFPIIQNGKVRGFGGRIVNEGEPKYLNSPATPVFRKKETLFGLIPSALKEEGRAIIVEGYLDVIMCHQHGYRNTVSPLGTALGSDHIKIIKKYCDTMYTVFDGDEAGTRAAEMTAKLMLDEQIKGGVAILPEGDDPDTFLRKGTSLEPLLSEASPYSVFLALKFPKDRKMVFNMILSRPPLDVEEFLSQIGTTKEFQMYFGLRARFVLEDLFVKGKLLIRKKDIEVKKYAHYLALFHKKGFVVAERCGEDHQKQAQEMTQNFVKLTKRTMERETS